MVRSILAACLAAAVLFTAGCEGAKQVADKAAATAGNAATDATARAGDLMGQATAALSGVEGGSEMLKQVSDLFGKVTSTLGTVKDADTATAAVPEINKLTEGFGDMTDMFGKMPDAAKSAVADVFKNSLGQLQPHHRQGHGHSRLGSHSQTSHRCSDEQAGSFQGLSN